VISDSPVFAVKRDQKEVLAIQNRKLLAEAVKKLSGVLEFRVLPEGILRFLHKHDPVTGENVLEFLHV
jgi:hypothetical protein